jgi:hypothetical protein
LTKISDNKTTKVLLFFFVIMIGWNKLDVIERSLGDGEPEK